MTALRSFTISNYRSFDRPVRVDLAPLTLVYGENNAGKSGILRWLPFLADSFDPRVHGSLNLDSVSIRGAGFPDILCRATESQTLEMTLEWDGARVEGHYREFDGAVRAARFTLQSDGEKLEGVWTGIEDRYDTSLGTLDVRFRGPVPQPSDSLPAIVEEIASRAERLPKEVLWLEATREPIQREEPATRTTPVRLGSRGERAVAACAADDEVRRWVSEWFARSFGLEFVIQRLARHVRPELLRKFSPFAIPLSDCGEGFSQVLPVAVASAMAALQRGPRLLCIEHPELHLHPDAHPSIAGLFTDLLVSKDPPCVILETHSENLLLAVLLGVASGRLGEDDIAIYWVRQREDGTSAVDRVSLSSGARLGPEFPPGVFKQDMKLAKSLLEKRREQE